MKPRMRTLRLTLARLLTASLLFSALSPALAATLFAGRADVLARLLGLSTADVPQAVVCHDGAAVPATNLPDGDHRDHAHGGMYCSFCLAPQAGLALPGLPFAGLPWFDFLLPPPRVAYAQPTCANDVTVFDSRAPPLTMV